jgi:hypothetical protein
MMVGRIMRFNLHDFAHHRFASIATVHLPVERNGLRNNPVHCLCGSPHLCGFSPPPSVRLPTPDSAGRFPRHVEPARLFITKEPACSIQILVPSEKGPSHATPVSIHLVL